MYNLYDFGYYPCFLPKHTWLAMQADLPPTLYSIMQSMVNYDNPNPVKIKDLALACHDRVFNFDYPLSPNVDKTTFETNILNNFLERRINFDTFNMFRIKLGVRLNEILPKYNVMFNSIKNWDLFKDGLIIEKDGTVNDSRNLNRTNDSNTSGSGESENVSKYKHSDLPQGELQNIDDSKYVNSYDNNTDNNTNSTSVENHTAEENTENKENVYHETIKQSQNDLAKLYIDFQNDVQSIYTMIYNDLDCLFYGLV